MATPDTRELVIHPCKGECRWQDTGGTLGGQQLFACAACGSEWTPTQAWTPQDADGSINPQVAAARAAR